MGEERTANPYDSERRIATVMFADISGFTALSEKLDPERVTEVMNGCFQRLEAVVFSSSDLRRSPTVLDWTLTFTCVDGN